MSDITKIREVVGRIREIDGTRFDNMTIGEIQSTLDDALALAELVEELDTQMCDGDMPDEWADAFHEDEE